MKNGYLWRCYKRKHKYNLNWPLILDLPHRILMIEGSGSGKTNVLINLIKQQDDYYSITVKIYLHVKDSYEKNINILFKKREKWSWKSGRF